MIRWLLALVLAGAAAVGVLYLIAGRGTPPLIVIERPDRMIGQDGQLEVTVGGPKPTSLSIALQQNGQTIPLFSLGDPQSATLTEGETGLRIVRALGKKQVPQLQQGNARLVVEASRPSFMNLRVLSSSAAKDFQVRLEPPRVSALSTHHYINRGGSELVIYRTTPADVQSGVRVGEVEYPGYPASGAGVTGEGAVKLAFFALLADQPISTRIALFARDEAGNETTTPFVDDVFDKRFKQSRIEIDDRFLQRVVPEILSHAPELKLGADTDLLPGFLRINGDLRRLNAERIASLTLPSSSSRLWEGPFVQLGNSQVEAGFADQRTYIYQGKDVDKQVHLGYDLAVTSAVPVVAANAGKVVNASWLGIYGNCVILDHGMGIASLYGHLSSIDVAVGDSVTKGQVLGKSGMTGLAGGDHLHFTMLVNARAVNPVEWWDLHWIQDRVERKLRDAGGSSTTSP